MPFFTIIIPIYNVEKYLNKCLKSIQNQSFRDFEAILVDDESPDKCPQICDEIVQQDSRFSVIHKKNAGAGYARNTGLDVARGEYIVFVDPDDYIDIECLQYFYNHIKDEKADVCYGGVYDVISDKVIKEDFLYKEGTFLNEEIRKNLLVKMVGKAASEKKGPIPMSVWRGIYKNSLLKENKIHFLSEREFLSEDYLFTFDVLTKAQVVSCTKYYFYYHIKDNMESLSTKYNPNRFNVDRAYSLYQSFEKKSKEIGYEQCYRERIQAAFLSNIIVCLKQTVGNRSEFGKNKTITLLSKIISDMRVQEVLNEYPYRHESFKRRWLFHFMKRKNSWAVYFIMLMGENLNK